MGHGGDGVARLAMESRASFIVQRHAGLMPICVHRRASAAECFSCWRQHSPHGRTRRSQHAVSPANHPSRRKRNETSVRPPRRAAIPKGPPPGRASRRCAAWRRQNLPLIVKHGGNSRGRNLGRQARIFRRRCTRMHADGTRGRRIGAACHGEQSELHRAMACWTHAYLRASACICGRMLFLLAPTSPHGPDTPQSARRLTGEPSVSRKNIRETRHNTRWTTPSIYTVSPQDHPSRSKRNETSVRPPRRAAIPKGPPGAASRTFPPGCAAPGRNPLSAGLCHQGRKPVRPTTMRSVKPMRRHWKIATAGRRVAVHRGQSRTRVHATKGTSHDQR